MTAFGEWCADQGMPLAYHHHMAAAIETEAELDLFMKHSGEGIPLLYDAGHMAFAGGDVLRVIDKHHARITHVHTKDVRMDVIDGLDRTRESFLDAVVKGAFTVPGDGSLDFEAIVKKLAAYGYEGWFVVEAEQDPKVSPAARDGEDRPQGTAARHGRRGLQRGGVKMNRIDGKVCVVTGIDPGSRRRDRPPARRGGRRRRGDARAQRRQGQGGGRRDRPRHRRGRALRPRRPRERRGLPRP